MKPPPYFEPPQMRVKDYIRFLEWQEARDEAKMKKKEENDKKKKELPKGHTFTFAEGVIIAYVAQAVLPSIWKVALIHLGVQ